MPKYLIQTFIVPGVFSSKRCADQRTSRVLQRHCHHRRMEASRKYTWCHEGSSAWIQGRNYTSSMHVSDFIYWFGFLISNSMLLVRVTYSHHIMFACLVSLSLSESFQPKRGCGREKVMRRVANERRQCADRLVQFVCVFRFSSFHVKTAAALFVAFVLR